VSCALGPESVGELEQAARALRHGDVDELAAREPAGLAAGFAQLTLFKPQLHIRQAWQCVVRFRGDFFAAALVGAILARERRDHLLTAVATFVVTQAFDQLFMVVDTLPASVPPALVMLALESRRRRPVHGSARPLPAR
jgi:hypothetical protein